MNKERRKYKRLPLTISISAPIRIELHTDRYDGVIPGILVNLSAGGMALLVFHYLPEESRVDFNLDFMGVKADLSGKIVREEKKFDETYMVGIEFEKVAGELEELVEKMAEDHDICQVRYLIDPQKACFPDCSFRELCGQVIKKDFPEVKQ